jgi:hypothetical protein
MERMIRGEARVIFSVLCMRRGDVGDEPWVWVVFEGEQSRRWTVE